MKKTVGVTSGQKKRDREVGVRGVHEKVGLKTGSSRAPRSTGCPLTVRAPGGEQPPALGKSRGLGGDAPAEAAPRRPQCAALRCTCSREPALAGRLQDWSYSGEAGGPRGRLLEGPVCSAAARLHLNSKPRLGGHGYWR